jgi:hypothetical protein
LNCFGFPNPYYLTNGKRLGGEKEMKALNFIPALILVLVTINSDLFQKKFWTEQGSLEKNQSTYFGVEKKQENMRKKAKEEIMKRQIQKEIFEEIMVNTSL